MRAGVAMALAVGRFVVGVALGVGLVTVAETEGPGVVLPAVDGREEGIEPDWHAPTNASRPITASSEPGVGVDPPWPGDVRVLEVVDVDRGAVRMVGPALLGLLTTDVAAVEPRGVVGIHRGVVVGTWPDRGVPPAAVHDLHLADPEALLVQTCDSHGPARDARVDHDRSPGPVPVEPPEVDR